MASRWPSVSTSVRRRSLRDQEQLEENEVLQPAPGHLETSSRALGSLCRQFQRRLPLRAVSLNLGAGPSWKRLEAPEPGQQGLQAAARSAKNALGAVSQRSKQLQGCAEGRFERAGCQMRGVGRNMPFMLGRIQESCQTGTKWLVETQVKARRSRRETPKDSSPHARSLSQRSTRFSGTTPARSTPGPWERERHRLSTQRGPRAHPLRRSRREAAFRSPYSSTEPLCSPSESDSDLEPVGAGIQHLQKLSQELDEAIMAEERKQAVPDPHAPHLRSVPPAP
uniref:PICALM interacting mitotic regulator n=1 Tax=Molossus molossus TaxID=27622 RepID=A0A7J8D0W3_MOLMO|nr:PICALM interacting mitotic regulator [Molossus molossus]